jgi:transposase InsO family protein
VGQDQQQARFEAFVREFNFERPHEALAMKTPAAGLQPLDNPFGARLSPRS